MKKTTSKTRKTKPLNKHDVSRWAFNLNQSIRVMLNDNGYQRLADLHNEWLGTIPNWQRRDAEYFKKQADKDGYTKYQMWHFMECFGGDAIGMTKPNLFYLTIQIDASELQPCG